MATASGVNVFEGCRRIALALKVAWLIVVAIVTAVVGSDEGASAIGYAALAGTTGWLVLSLLQTAIGWIARGFAGIPLGHDHRPETGPPR